MEQLTFKYCCCLRILAGKGNAATVAGVSDFLSPPFLSKGSHTSWEVLHTRVTHAASLAEAGSRETPLCFRKHFRIPRSQDWQGWEQLVELQCCCLSFSAEIMVRLLQQKEPWTPACNAILLGPSFCFSKEILQDAISYWKISFPHCWIKRPVSGHEETVLSWWWLQVQTDLRKSKDRAILTLKTFHYVFNFSVAFSLLPQQYLLQF